MTQHAGSGSRRVQAKIIGLGLDGRGGPHRIITGRDYLMLGGSQETHDEMLETVLRLEVELERRGQELGEVGPEDLAEIAWRIDSPELHAIALQMEAGLLEAGRSFEDSTAEELTELAAGRDD